MKRNDSYGENADGPNSSATSSVSKWSRLRRIRIGIVVALLVCMVAIWRLGVMEEPLDRWLNPENVGRLGFTVTTYPKLNLPPHPTLHQRFTYGYQNLRFAWQYHTRNPKRLLLGPQPPENWDISRLLYQCMWVSGTRYLIAKDVRGEIRFGTTNALNGSEWAAAAEHALQENGMAVIHVRPKLVQVVPNSQLQEYRKAGLVEGASNLPGQQ